MTTVLEPAQKEAIEQEVSPLIDQAHALVVRNDEQRTLAVTFGKNLKELKVRIEERFHPTANREKALKLWQESKDTENAFYKPIDDAIETVKKTITAFDREEAIKQQRAADEAAAKQEEERRKEEAKLLKKAETAQKNGHTEKAEAFLEQAENVTVKPVFIPNKDVKKLVWKARVVNQFLACKSIGEGLIPFTAVEFKQASLNDLGKAYESNKQAIPGIAFYQDVNGRI